MSQIVNKSAISVLDEFCKRKLQPQAVYKFTSDTAPEFVCEVEAFNEMKVGKDKSKKKAKHEAARNLISHLRNLESFKFDLMFLNVPENAEACSSTTAEKKLKAASKSKPEINYVGKLLEYCVKNKLPPASFDMVDHTANSQRHLSEFCMKCSVNDVEKQGKGFNKKQAKQNAAMEVLTVLTAGQPEPKDVSSSNEPETKQLKSLSKSKQNATTEVLTVFGQSQPKDVSSSNELQIKQTKGVEKRKKNAAMEMLTALAAKQSEVKDISSSVEPSAKRFKSLQKPDVTDTSSSKTENTTVPKMENKATAEQFHSFFDHFADESNEADYEEEESGGHDFGDCDEIDTMEDYSAPSESDSLQGFDYESESDQF